MSFWGATVITNLITAVPVVGEPIAYWLWGGFSVGNPTLNRFLSIHFLLPFLILGLVFVHLSLLHEGGSTNPLGVASYNDSVYFGRLFAFKDSFGLFCVIIGVLLLVGFYPNLLGHSDNYIPANPLVTPPHIVPEWYFLPFYAILRAIPDKLGGVTAMVLAIIIFILLPFAEGAFSIKKTKFSLFNKLLLSMLFCVFLFLGYIGGKPAVFPFVSAGAIAAVSYFTLVGLFFLF
jgi:quinol-cytochrome oxidoreductase complex cytochrome b subunit